jgi:tetratricopeptide (TPR) repeat protein
MKTRTLLITSLISLWFSAAAATAPDPVLEADALLQAPGLSLPQALQALALYEQALSQPHSPKMPLLIRLARACFLIGELTTDSQRRQYYEKGRAFAEDLLKEAPSRVEGHYWRALHLCGLADVGGALQGKRLLPKIMEELNRARALDEAYDQAGSHRILGRIYYQAPAWPFSVGDLQKSLDHLARAVRLAPGNSTNHLYLAETLLRLNRPAEARRELELALKAPHHAWLTKGLEEDRKEARQRLKEVEAPPSRP